jgi:protein O-GlcNAc transferase
MARSSRPRGFSTREYRQLRPKIGELAKDLFRECIRLDPRPEAYLNLAFVLHELGQEYDAVDAYQRALERMANAGDAAHFCLAYKLAALGRARDSVRWYRSSLALSESPSVRSSFIMALGQYHPDYDDRGVLEEAREFDRLHAQPLASKIRPHTNDRSPDRRLRVGYVSPNFFKHVQAQFQFPLLGNHDHTHFEIFCYSDVAKPDDWTADLLRHADQSRNILGKTDTEVADLVRRDGVDILVDLTIHMPQNRLLVFARKPAPVQLTWLAYPGTTGVSAIDYRITDPWLDPPGSDLTVYSEKSIHLESFWIWSPMSEVAVGPLPARTSGITFGCLNGSAKVNDEVLALWSRVLRAVPGARFLMLFPEGLRTRTLATFQRNGIDARRIEFVGEQPRDAYLATYRRVDLILDTFPAPAHTTALDSWWMGVPVVSLLGKTIVSRAPLSIVSNLGLPKLVARTPDEYVNIAVGLCSDLDYLTELRAELRPRMEKSPLIDAPRFVRNLETAYRSIWREWCDVTK